MNKESNVVQFTIIDRENNKSEYEAPTDFGFNLMEICKSFGLPVKGTCGGMALCASCHLYVIGEHNLPAPNDAELEMLDSAFFVQTNSRLGCQIKVDEKVDGLIFQLAPEHE